MSDAEAQNNSDDAEGGKPRGGKKKLIIIIAVVVLLLGGGAGAYFAGLFGGGDEPAAEEAIEESGGEHAEEAAAEHGSGEEESGEHGGEKGAASAEEGSLYYELPDFLVNLSSNTGQPSFIKMKVSLVLESAKDRPMVDEGMPILQDMFNTYLRDLRASDLSGSAGIYRLREELLARANKSLAPVRIKNILFQQIMVQ